MLGHMNKQAYERTVSTGYVTFFSRSRRKLWTKGESSGHRLRVSEIRADCDRDALLILADLTGPGCCHLGYKSCFFRQLTPHGEKVIAKREFDPQEIYGESVVPFQIDAPTSRARPAPARHGRTRRLSRPRAGNGPGQRPKASQVRRTDFSQEKLERH
jgi:phosphoribosyl-AMP cyclohydrolase